MIKNIYYNFIKYKFLLYELVVRDFKVKYKRSVLGVVWSLLYPILLMTVMALVFSNLFKFRAEGQNYLVYLMTGIVMFNYFAEATNNTLTSIVGNFSLINKVYIPKYIFPLSKCLFVGINFVLTLIPWFAIVLLSYVGFGEYTCYITVWYLLLPFIFICFFMFTIGISFILSCVSVFLRDVIYIYGIVLTLWNYLTPVFYSASIIPEKFLGIYQMNPMYQFLTITRTIVVESTAPSFGSLVTVFLWGFLTLVVGAFIFKKNQDKFVYYI